MFRNTKLTAEWNQTEIAKALQFYSFYAEMIHKNFDHTLAPLVLCSSGVHFSVFEFESWFRDLNLMFLILNLNFVILF